MTEKVILTYDRSFEGFLSLVFHIYDRKIIPHAITTSGLTTELFSTSLTVPTDKTHAQRVLDGLLKKTSKRNIKFMYACFLSEKEGIEMKILHLIKHTLSSRPSKISDFSDPIIMDLHKVKKMIRREVHRMHAFVRFQETKDNLWACEINPDFNVLPLIGKHFKDRYPALEWIIYDNRRHYAIHHADHAINYATIESLNADKLIGTDVLSEEEKKYQALWKQYFKSVNIEERNNPKLHLRHVPKRYWPFLIEKQ